MQSLRKFGYELEYASNANAMVIELHNAGIMRTAFLHDYHCSCGDCSYVEGPTRRNYDDHECDIHCDRYGCWLGEDHDCGYTDCPLLTSRNVSIGPPADLRAQRDSTADGEFITRPLEDWDDFHRITNALTAAASNAGASAGARCGLHVHVDTSDDFTDLNRYGDRTTNLSDRVLGPTRSQRRRIVPAAYLAFERYFTEIVAPGASIRKRDMNQTLMEAARQWVSDQFGTSNPEAWMDMGRGQVDEMLLQIIGRDRHVDLNWNRRHGTWEFRVFNSTNAPWRIELACRMSVAFVEAATELRQQIENVVRGSKFWPPDCDSPWGEIIRPAYSTLPVPHPTKRPVVPMSEFVDVLCDKDPDLRPLIERQANFMLTRYAQTVEHAS